MDKIFPAVLAAAVLAMGGPSGCASRPNSEPTRREMAESEAIPGKRAQPPQAERSTALFDGKTLKGWRIVEFAGAGEIEVATNSLLISMGASLTGLTYTNPIPRFDYEVSLLAARVDGTDFFCGLTFPVGESFCSLILGGWGGAVVGLSSIDGADASMNETTQYRRFEKARYYRVRLRVTRQAIQVWLDEERIINQPLEGHTINLRPGEIDRCAPLGLSTWQTTAVWKDIRLRALAEKAKG